MDIQRLIRLAEMGDNEAIVDLLRYWHRRGDISEENLAGLLALKPDSISRPLASAIGEHIGRVGGIGPMLSEALRHARWQMLRRIAKAVYQAHGPLRNLKVEQLIAGGQIPTELPVPLTRPQLEERQEFEHRIDNLEKDEDSKYRYEQGSEYSPSLSEWLGIKWWGYYMTEEVIQVYNTEDDYEQLGEATRDHQPWVIEDMFNVLQAHAWRDSNNDNNHSVELFGEEEDEAMGMPVQESVYYSTNVRIARDSRGGQFPADLTEQEIDSIAELAGIYI